jgi:hypothetical protein
VSFANFIIRGVHTGGKGWRIALAPSTAMTSSRATAVLAMMEPMLRNNKFIIFRLHWGLLQTLGKLLRSARSEDQNARASEHILPAEPEVLRSADSMSQQHRIRAVVSWIAWHDDKC